MVVLPVAARIGVRMAGIPHPVLTLHLRSLQRNFFSAGSPQTLAGYFFLISPRINLRLGHCPRLNYNQDILHMLLIQKVITYTQCQI
jgi:hypothetical protein